MLGELPFHIENTICNNLLSDGDRMNVYHLNRQFRNSRHKHIGANILKQYMKMHGFETVDDFSYIAGFYPTMDLIKFLQYIFDTPRGGYFYEPFTSEVKKRRNHELFKNMGLMRIISRRNKTLDGLLDSF